MTSSTKSFNRSSQTLPERYVYLKLISKSWMMKKEQLGILDLRSVKLYVFSDDGMHEYLKSEILQCFELRDPLTNEVYQLEGDLI